MLKTFTLALLLTASAGVYASTSETQDSKAAPTPLDMMSLMSTYLGGEVSAQQLFDLGVEANMRIPLQHMRVKFTDLRTGLEMTREDRAHILGQARQDWSHDLILRTLSTFTFPGVNSDQLIDLFDAAALASMRLPPTYVDIQFYDERLGAEEAGEGGVSGRIPDTVYAPSKLPEDEQVTHKDWTELTIVDYFIANEKTLHLQSLYEFVIPYSVVANDLAHLNQTVRADFKQLLEIEAGLDIDFANQKHPFFTQAAVGTEGEMRRYIGLVHLKTGDKEKAKEIREVHPALYNHQ